MVNNAIRLIVDGKSEYAIEELYQAIQKADGYLHEDIADVIAKNHERIWNKRNEDEY